MTKFVVYLRTSTKSQDYGIVAQRETVNRFLATLPSPEMVSEFVEQESGKKAKRPELTKALNKCKAYRATLLVAKVDRLARNYGFLTELMETGIEIKFLDLPDASRAMLPMMAAMAEMEGEAISVRTKAALAIAKKSGVVLGNPNGARDLLPHVREGAKASAEKRLASSREWAESLRTEIVDLLHLSDRAISETLNERGCKPRRGDLWNAPGVWRLRRILAAV